MDDSLKKILEDGIKQIDSMLLSESLTDRLEILFDRISMFNHVYKLVGAEGRDLVVKHLLDCLAPVPIIRKYIGSSNDSVSFADLGSGSGLPGIVLASAIDNGRFSLVERMGRRAGFLRNVIATAELSDRVCVVEKTLEDVKTTFDFISFRAFRQMKDIAADLKRITRSGSVVFAYKSQEDNVSHDIVDLNNMIPNEFYYSVVDYQVPFFNAKRCLLIITRI